MIVTFYLKKKVSNMPKDPLGFIARLNAMSLMLITPEFHRIRRLRGKNAGRVNRATNTFSMKPVFTDINGLSIRIARVKKGDANNIVSQPSASKHSLL